MLLAPLALILSLLAIPIVLMYVLKLRRQEYVVPSTLLWRQALEDVQANAPWQRLRFNILLLLQLLALAAVILALARPAYSRSHVVAGDLVLIVDQSYGMQARDVAPSRFAAAVDRARVIATDVAGGNVISVIAMGAQPRLAIAESGDQGAVRAALGSLKVGVDQPNFLEALSLAASLARSGQGTRAVVLTSRQSGIADLPLHVSFPVDIERVGGRLRDLGITVFGASARASTVEAVARVTNFGAAPASSDLELYIDGALADVRPLTFAANREQNVFWTNLPATAQQLQVRLKRPDDVTSDKSAWAVVRTGFTRHVLLVSRGDFFLEAALLDDPFVSLSSVAPAAYLPGMERGFDLVIFDGVLPPALPASATLLVTPPAGRAGPLRFGRNLAAGAVSEASPAPALALGSVLKYVDLSDVHVAQLRSTSLPGWMQTLVVSGDRPLLAAGEKSGSRYAVLALDPQRSDWPLRISFPIVVQNLVGYLAPGLTLGATNLSTGQAVTFLPPPGTKSLRVARSDGATTTLSPPFPPFAATSRPGLYTVTAVAAGSQPAAGNGRLGTFAVNFFPARPAPAPGPATIHLGHIQAGKGLIASAPVNFAWVLIVAALSLLGVEWWVAFRGGR